MVTNKNKEFVREYVSNGFHAGLAYIKVYGCAPQTANSNAYRVLGKPEVQEYMKEVQKERLAAQAINAERVLDKLAEIAFAGAGDEFYGANAQLKALELIQKQLGVNIQKIDADLKTKFVVDIEE